MSHLPATTDKTFAADIATGGAVVDFWGEGWGACVRLAPVVEQLAGEHKDVKFLAIDAHNNYDTAAQFGIMGLPTLLFFKGGKEVARLVGYQQKPKIEEAIKKVKSLSQ